MPWFQVDDQLALHPKVSAAGNAAMGLWVRAGAWSMQNLTEGFVPTAIARTIGSATQAARLVDTGLWKAVPGGYRFHEWGTRQMSAEEIRERRRRREEAGRKGGQATAAANAQANAQASAAAEPKQNCTPVPVPVLPVVTYGGELTQVEQPPPRFCSRHPDGTESPCGACKRAREAHEDAVKALEADELARKRDAKARVDSCPNCLGEGWYPLGDDFVAKCSCRQVSHA